MPQNKFNLFKKALPFLILLIFWTNGVAHLDTLPLVHEDEPWILSPGYTFWQEGRFGSDLFTGFHGMENHFFGFLPLVSLLNGGLAHLIGVGLFQTRFGLLSSMFLALAATHRLGRVLFSAQVGTVAILLLAFLRIAGPFYHLQMGIPFADAARIARYDMAVPAFALLALLSFIEALKYGRPILFFVAGLLVGLATLSHIYGAFWLITLMLTYFWISRRWRLKPIVFMGLGFGLICLPYLIYVASAWSDFLEQNFINAGRVAITSPAFYLANLLNEVERYDAILNGAKQQLGSWLFLVALPLATLLLVYKAVWKKNSAAKIILAPLLGLVFGFAFLITPKTFTYLATLWPLFAIIMAVGLVHLWRATAAPFWWRPALIAILVVAMAEGSWSMVKFHQKAAKTTSYPAFTAQLARHISPQSKVLALQHYWLGLPDFNYRALLVPFFLVSERHSPMPISFYQALQQVEPDVIIIDEVMQNYFDEIASVDHPGHAILLDFNQYLLDHHAQIITQFQDPSYGRVTIYRLAEESP